jgi:hypothetical protein
MPNPPPEHNFELNCFFTQPEFNLSGVHFKELQLASGQNYEYGRLRGILRHTDSIWYAQGRSIYLVGQAREIRTVLNANTIETTTVRLVPYTEMLARRESVLRFLLYSAFGRLMRQRGFTSSLSGRQRSYYPLFDSKETVRVAHKLVKPDFTAVAKNGLVLDLDLSPDGPALLWIDSKLFTFVHFKKPSLESGEPAYLLCDKTAECASQECSSLLEGVFVTEDANKDLLVLTCAEPEAVTTLIVRSRSREQTVQVPYDYLYTTVSPHELKELGIYDWWRSKAMPRPPERYSTIWQLIRLIAKQAKTLTVPFPGDQRVVFALRPIGARVKMRFA